MYYFPDVLVLLCLFVSGLFFGYYCKFAFVYEHLWAHWYALVGIVTVQIVAAIMTWRKVRQKRNTFDHFYVILCGLVCLLISSCFLMIEHLEASFYFGFISHGTVFVPSFSYISLRSSSHGFRPSRIALGNTMYFTGLATGFAIFSATQPRQSAWICMGMSIALIVAIIAAEILHLTGSCNYKKSNDVLFNLMNDEGTVFVKKKAICAQHLGRDIFYFTRDKQNLTVISMLVVLIDRSMVFSISFMELTFASTLSYTEETHPYMQFAIYAIGCSLGSLMMTWFKPKLMHLIFCLIKVVATAAILGVYTEAYLDNCFIFLCIFYMTMGGYSSIPLQGLLESAPFKYSELIFASAYQIELVIIEALKYEKKRGRNFWPTFLGIGVAVIVLSIVSIILVQLFLPHSEGLISIRNKLIGIRRQNVPAPHRTELPSGNYFLHQNVKSSNLKSITIEKNRVFQQYPSHQMTKKTRF